MALQSFVQWMSQIWDSSINAVKTFLAPYSALATGELAGSVTAVQMPNVACRLVNFKAVLSNAGNVYIGGSGVTKVDGTTDTTSGWQLGPGDETGPLPYANVNVFYRICDNAGDDLTYIACS